MSFKKKLTMGAMSATLGISLVAGGTWAAFNDIEDVTGNIAAGELDLVVTGHNGPKNFVISDLKPGDSMTRYIKLDNQGTLAIKDVLLSIDNVEFDDYLEGTDPDTFGSNSLEEYLDQFQVTLLRTGIEGADEEIISSGEKITLKDLYLATNPGNTHADVADAISRVSVAVGSTSLTNNHWTDGRVNLASVAENQWTGLPAQPRDHDIVEMKIEFVEYSVRDDRGVEEQNKYQGDTADITFTLEARQWDGKDYSGVNGVVEDNKKARNGQ